MFADTAELMDGTECTDRGEVADLHVAGQRGVVGEDCIRTDVTVVRHVRVSHEEILPADGGCSAASGRPAIHGDEFAKDVVIADGQLGALAAILEILRRTSDRGMAVEVVPSADERRALDAAEVGAIGMDRR